MAVAGEVFGAAAPLISVHCRNPEVTKHAGARPTAGGLSTIALTPCSAPARATAYPGSDYGLICFFDCVHVMGDPLAAAQHAAQAVAPDGTVLLVEPFNLILDARR